MADKNARTLSQTSNRAKPKDKKEKKVVFKGVLDNPFRIQWPSIPLNLQNSILAYILELLKGASECHQKRCALSRKRKREVRAAESSPPKKKTKKTDNMDISEPVTVKSSENITAAPVSSTYNPDPFPNAQEEEQDESPLFMRHLLYGINAVTKRLEIQAQNARRCAVTPRPESTTLPPKSLKYVFVCRADVDPALLIDHLPHLVAAYNSTRPAQPIKLVPLPKGSELVIAQVLGIRRVTVLAVDVDFPDDSNLMTMLEPVPILAASWLTQSNLTPSLIPTHIKHLRTTAPKDMKEAKEARMQGKATAKKRKLAQKYVASNTADKMK